MRYGYVIFALTLVTFTEPAFALRCGNRIVSEGDHQSKIHKYCGEPTAVTYRTVYRSGIPATQLRQSSKFHREFDAGDELLVHQRSLVEVQVEEWTYNFGPRRLMRVIRFENGVVTDVSHLGYGYIE